MQNKTRFFIAILTPLAIGALSSVFTVTGVNSWYRLIQKPSWNPPDQIFGPVWTALYILMGLAWYLVWRADISPRKKKQAHFIFAIQLALNFCWSFIFFNQHAIGWALVEIIILWMTILATIFIFARISRLASWLLVPYISWVSFALLLNYTIWQLNAA